MYSDCRVYWPMDTFTFWIRYCLSLSSACVVWFTQIKMACQICLTLHSLPPLSNNCYRHRHRRHRHHYIKPKALKQHHSQRNPNKDTTLLVLPQLSLTKRSLISSSFALILNGFLPLNSIAELELQTYTDVDQGFTLLRPSSWTKVQYNSLF